MECPQTRIRDYLDDLSKYRSDLYKAARESARNALERFSDKKSVDYRAEVTPARVSLAVVDAINLLTTVSRMIDEWGTLSPLVDLPEPRLPEVKTKALTEYYDQSFAFKQERHLSFTEYYREKVGPEHYVGLADPFYTQKGRLRRWCTALTPESLVAEFVSDYVFNRAYEYFDLRHRLTQIFRNGVLVKVKVWVLREEPSGDEEEEGFVTPKPRPLDEEDMAQLFAMKVIAEGWTSAEDREQLLAHLLRFAKGLPLSGNTDILFEVLQSMVGDLPYKRDEMIAKQLDEKEFERLLATANERASSGLRNDPRGSYFSNKFDILTFILLEWIFLHVYLPFVPHQASIFATAHMPGECMDGAERDPSIQSVANWIAVEQKRAKPNENIKSDISKFINAFVGTWVVVAKFRGQNRDVLKRVKGSERRERINVEPDLEDFEYKHLIEGVGITLSDERFTQIGAWLKKKVEERERNGG